MVLLMIALVGFVVPNSFILYWLFYEFDGIGGIWDNRLALGFIIDIFLTMVMLGYYFARKPIGEVKWVWFVLLSLIGGLAFSLPFYFWLNRRTASPRPTRGAEVAARDPFVHR